MTSIQQIPPIEGMLQRLRQELPRLREEYDVEHLAIFGSYARNAQRKESDLDVLVVFRVIPGLLKYITLEQHLSDLLDVPVDLIMESTLRPELVAHISSDRRPV